MENDISNLSRLARNAVQAQDWETVLVCANKIVQLDPKSAEGYFLGGLFERIASKPLNAIRAFEKSLALDPERYDAAVELANQYSIARRNAEALKLLDQYVSKLGNSPMYLDLAGTVYTEIGLPQKAWPLYKKVNELQPGVDLFQANLASASVYLGKVDEAIAIYKKLLERFPNHRRNHYQLARLEKARDNSHILKMENVLAEVGDTDDKNIFMYYALGKEYEDLGQWEKAFAYYKKGGDAVTAVARYDINSDLRIIDKIIHICTAEWLADSPVRAPLEGTKTPIFIVGLPRTGTTLTERIISSHSQVHSVGETQFLQMILRRESGVESLESMNEAMLEAVSKIDLNRISRGYLEALDYRLGQEPLFIEKLPFNFLYLGFIAKAMPNARIVHLRRNPMDSCFSMYKQIFTWAYKFSYSLENLGTYIIAHERLRQHWKDVLKDRFIEVEYESLVSDQETQTRNLLNKLGLEFEQACLNFESNTAPSATASSVQIREKAHSRSVNKWKYFSELLEPLRAQLEEAGIEID